METLTFDKLVNEILEEKNKYHTRRPKRKFDKRVEYERPFYKDLLDIRAPSERKHSANSLRGTTRKSLFQTSAKYNPASFSNVSPGTEKVVKQAKKAGRGFVRKLTKRDVMEIALKYKFNVPDDRKPLKHLGSTGIKMIRKGPGQYYLIKV